MTAAFDIFSLLAQLGWQQSATIEAFLYVDGTGAEHYDTPVVVQCFRDDKRRLVRAAGADEVISETTLYLPLGTVCPVHSRVTLDTDGRKATVLQALRRDGGGLPTPDHLEVLLT